MGNSANSAGTAYDNSTGLGNDGDPNASNKVRVGNTSVTEIGGQVSWSTLSDRRFKADVKQDEVKGLEFISRLQPVTYNYDIDAYADWKEQNYGERDTANWKGKYDIEKIRFSGFIAQDVEQIAKETGYDFSGVSKPANDKDIYSLRYAEFVVPLVKAVQELNAENKLQNQLIENKDEEMTALKERLDRMEELLSRFDSDLEQCCLDHEQGSAIPTAGAGLDDDQASLSQNEPNPFRENTLIKYYLPSNTRSATMQISNMEGVQLKSFTLDGKGYGQVLISGGTFSAGTYIYTLTVNGERVDSKRMMLL
jgi:hypothetical protein